MLSGSAFRAQVASKCDVPYASIFKFNKKRPQSKACLLLGVAFVKLKRD